MPTYYLYIEAKDESEQDIILKTRDFLKATQKFLEYTLENNVTLTTSPINYSAEEYKEF